MGDSAMQVPKACTKAVYQFVFVNEDPPASMTCKAYQSVGEGNITCRCGSELSLCKASFVCRGLLVETEKL
eukprot:55964-Eustigmatos_ZCMA.PRE.2